MDKDQHSGELLNYKKINKSGNFAFDFAFAFITTIYK